MPRVARFRIAAIGDLYRQLKYAPPEARRRQMRAAEKLAAEIDRGQVYPQDFIVFRITGYRPDRAEPDSVLVGEALVGDLVTFIQRLSAGLDIEARGEERAAVRLEDVARRLNVSVKTLQRYRRRGLVCHYLVFPDGVKRLACFEDALTRFMSANHGRLDRAAAFSRLDVSTVREIVEEARRRHRAQGTSLNATARMLAGEHGRAHETLRAILRRHDRRADEPIFGEHGVLTRRDVRVIARAASRGVPAATLARRFGKSAPTIHRAINADRRLRLAALDLRGVEMDADEPAVLDDPAVNEGLVAPEPRLDALALLESAPRRAPAAGPEPVLVAAYNLLKRRARTGLDRLPQHPGAGPLDAIETDLRWATLVKRRLVGLALPAALVAIERFLGRPLARQTAEEIVELLRLAIDATSGSVETLNPGRGMRAAVLAARRTDRALAASGPPPSTGRAGQRHTPGAVWLVGPFDRLCPWQAWLDLRGHMRSRIDRLDAPQRCLVLARYGLDGRRPRTLAEIAHRSGGTPSTVARALAAAERRLIAVR